MWSPGVKRQKMDSLNSQRQKVLDTGYTYGLMKEEWAWHKQNAKELKKEGREYDSERQRPIISRIKSTYRTVGEVER